MEYVRMRNKLFHLVVIFFKFLAFDPLVLAQSCLVPALTDEKCLGYEQDNIRYWNSVLIRKRVTNPNN